MENRLLPPPAKKMRTDGPIALATNPGQVSDPTLNRKNRDSKGCISLLHTHQIKAQNYRGALQEYFQKIGDPSLTFETKQISGDPHSALYSCTCNAGEFTGTGEARVKKLARQMAALATLKKMGLLPEGYEPTKKGAQEKTWPLTVAKKIQPQEVEQKTQPKEQEMVKKTIEDMKAERVVDKKGNTYLGTVKYYKPKQEFGFITIPEEIHFNGKTVTDKIYVHKDDIHCWSPTVGLHENTKVMFKVYTDSKGLGAYEVKKEDGTPIVFDLKLAEDEQSEVSMEPASEYIPRKKKEMKPMLENKQYVTGNFRGALQEYLVKIHPGVTVKFEAELLNSVSHTVVYVAKCKAVGEVPATFKGKVGTGHASVKKSAIHFAALDMMMKLDLLTEAQHFTVHQHWSCYKGNH